MADTPPLAKKQISRLNFENGDLMVALFGNNSPDAKRFTVHKDFACHYSPVFKAAFNSAFIEGQTQEYRFEDESDDIIRQLVFWIYTQRFDVPPLESTSTQEDNSVLSFADYGGQILTMSKLWILGDKLLMGGLQNSALQRIDQLHRKYDVVYGLCMGHLTYLYKSTAHGSLLRRYIANYYAYRVTWDASHQDKSIENFPSSMLYDIIVILIKDTPVKQRAPELKWTDYKVEEQ